MSSACPLPLLEWLTCKSPRVRGRIPWNGPIPAQVDTRT